VVAARAAAELLRQRPPADYLASCEHQSDLPRHVPHLDILAPLTAVACTTHFPPRIHETGEHVEVITSGKKLTFTAKALPALTLLLSGRPVDLDQATAVAGTEAVEVAKILVKEELCAPLTDELSSGYTGLLTSATS
jgi:hypothetical protein